MAIYRKNAGRALRWRKEQGLKMYTSMAPVQDDQGNTWSFEQGKLSDGRACFFRLKNGKKMPKADKSTDQYSKFQYVMSEAAAANELARRGSADVGRQAIRKTSKFVSDGQANVAAGRRMGAGRGAAQASTTKKQKKGKKGKKASSSANHHGYSSAMALAWGELGGDVSKGWAVWKGEMTLAQAKGGKAKKNPIQMNPRRNNGRGGISFYDLY